MIRLSDLEHITDAVENESLQQSSMLKKVVESQQQDLQMSPDVQRIIDGVNQMRERQQIRNRLSTYQRELSDMITGTGVNSYANGGIHIAKSKEGTFTAAASRHGMGVQEFASRVLANKGNYSPAMVKKANFARNAAKWHDYGGPLNVFNGGGPAFVTADTRSTIPEKRQGDAGPYAINEITVTPAGGYYNPIGIYPYEKPLNPSTIEYDLVTGGVFKKPLMVLSKYLGKKFVDSYAQNKSESPYPIDPRKLVELSPLRFAKGGSLRFNNAADMIEHFEGFRSTPYRDGKAYSVGYGQYMYGDGANLDWRGLLNGTKKISKQEAHQQVLRSIDKLKAQLRQTLGDDLYNSLTPGQLMGYLDTGYQRPASMIAAAKIHRQKGAQAAADALHVNGPFAQRNAARRAAFTGNWGSDSPDYTSTYPGADNGNTGGYMLERPEPIISQPDYSSDTEYNYWWNNEPEEQTDDEMLQQYIMASGAGSSVYPLQESTPIIELNSGPAFPQLFSEGGYLSPINIYGDGDYLIKDDPSYNDFLREYGLSQTPLEHIQLSDPHFRDAQNHGPGTYITGGPNGYLLTEPEILSKWRSWKLNNDPTQTANYDAPVPLDEVIITPDTDMLNKYQEIIPNKDLRQGLYEYIEGNLNDSDSKGAYNRMLDVLTYNGKSPSFDFNPIFTGSRGGTLTPYAVTSHMGPLANFGSNIYIDGKPSEYPNNRLYDYGFHMFSELPHWLQHLSVNGHRLNDNDLWNFREGYFPDVKMKHNGRRPYSTPGAEEFSAHSIIQPAIGAYVFNTTPHDFVERQLPGYYRNHLMSQNKYWYSRVRPTYQEPIRTMPQLLKFSEDMSRSAANYGYNQYMDWERKSNTARDMWNSGQ